MAKLLQDIWIMEESGIVVFHRVFNEHLDAQLFGGLMAALTSFAEKLTKGGLTQFELSDKRFTIIKKRGFLFIANSSKDIKEKKLIQELESIVIKFFDLYPAEILNSFNGEINKFSDFKKHVEDSLEDTIKKFQKSFW